MIPQIKLVNLSTRRRRNPVPIAITGRVPDGRGQRQMQSFLPVPGAAARAAHAAPGRE